MADLVGRYIDYNDEAALREVLVGRRIVEVREFAEKDWGYRDPLDHIEFVLDNGVTLEAIETDGGCSCSNGCFSVEQVQAAPATVITNVEVVEETDESFGDRDGVIKLFVYSEGISTQILESSGTDNGYYGWGFDLTVNTPKVVRNG